MSARTEDEDRAECERCGEQVDEPGYLTDGRCEDCVGVEA